MKIEIKKITLILLAFCVIVILLGYSINLYTDSKNKLDDSSLVTQGNQTIIPGSSLEEKIMKILSNGELGIVLKIYDYSMSPDGRYVFLSKMTKGGYIYYSLLDLEKEKDLFDSYTVAGSGELNTTNFLWTDNNQLIIASGYNAEGGEGFPGILVVDLNNQKFYRLVESSEKCPSNEIQNCIYGYTYDLLSFADNVLTYRLIFDSYSIGYDPSFSYEKDESIRLK